MPTAGRYHKKTQLTIDTQVRNGPAPMRGPVASYCSFGRSSFGGLLSEEQQIKLKLQKILGRRRIGECSLVVSPTSLAAGRAAPTTRIHRNASAHNAPWYQRNGAHHRNGHEGLHANCRLFYLQPRRCVTNMPVNKLY